MNPRAVLSDSELCRFLDDGYLLLDTSSIPDSTHDRLYEAAGRLYDLRGELKDPLASLETISDNLHVHVPLLNELFAHRPLDGALEAVLGPQYFRYGHSFIHMSGQFDQGYHKDSPLPWSTPAGMRSHRPNWAMVFYYPQAVSLEMGPTEILPGSQYWTVDRENEERKDGKEGEDRLESGVSYGDIHKMNSTERDHHFSSEVRCLDRKLERKQLVLPKGSMVLVHFDLFHRGTRSNSPIPRFLYKFWYVRTLEPEYSAETRRVISYQATDVRRQPLIVKQANWLGLDVSSPPTSSDLDDAEQEGDRVAAAHLKVESDVEALVDMACSGNEAMRRSAVFALVGHDEGARAAALRLHQSSQETERSCAAFLLGELQQPNIEDLENLLRAMTEDASQNVKTTAANALGRALRRIVSQGQLDIPSDLVNRWETALDRSAEKFSAAGIVQSAERQCVYTAMLNFVSSGIAANQPLPEFAAISALLSARIPIETDRYAKTTAIEVLSRLARFGDEVALEQCMHVLATERMNVVKAAA